MDPSPALGSILFCYTSGMKTSLYIDLDDTLLDNAALKQRITSLLTMIGLNADLKPSAFEECKKITGFYTPQSHLQILEASDQQVAEFEQAWLAEAPQLRQLLFPGTIAFLDKIDREHYIPKLLTLGDLAYQEYKVVNLGIAQYFDAIHITTQPKQLYLEQLHATKDSFILIDDRQDCRDAVSASFPNAQVFASILEARL